MCRKTSEKVIANKKNIGTDIKQTQRLHSLSLLSLPLFLSLLLFSTFPRNFPRFILILSSHAHFLSCFSCLLALLSISPSLPSPLLSFCPSTHKYTHTHTHTHTHVRAHTQIQDTEETSEDRPWYFFHAEPLCSVCGKGGEEKRREERGSRCVHFVASLTFR